MESRWHCLCCRRGRIVSWRSCNSVVSEFDVRNAPQATVITCDEEVSFSSTILAMPWKWIWPTIVPLSTGQCNSFSSPQRKCPPLPTLPTHFPQCGCRSFLSVHDSTAYGVRNHQFKPTEDWKRISDRPLLASNQIIKYTTYCSEREAGEEI